jgi:hypothetical protein
MENNLDNLVSDLLNRRTDKINREKELERIKFETFRENLINLFKALEPIHSVYGQLSSIYGNNKEYIIARGFSNYVYVKFSIKREAFILYKCEYHEDKCYTFTELKHNSLSDFKEWFKYYNFDENIDLEKIVDFFNKDLEHKIELLKREVE